MRGVQDTAELRRIAEIPRRVWHPADARSIADRWTDALARPSRTDCDDKCVCGGSGTMTLKPIQGVALSEIAQYNGGLFPIRVGGGKTLITLLASRVLPHVKRPLLLLPAHLIEKTEREKRLYRRHWQLSAFLRVESYQLLSRVSGATLLEEYKPDLILADEAHMLKNTTAACTKRLGRYLKAAATEDPPGVPLVILSGTFTKRSVKDFAHLSAWSLRGLSPIPLPKYWSVLDEWSRALDVNVAEHRRMSPGAMETLQESPDENIRVAYQRRLVQTPGVVATQEGPLPIGLKITSHVVPIDPVVRKAYETLRQDWTTPDDWPIEDGVAMWRHARELSSGFYSVWDPRPPDAWRDARREWAQAAREVIAHNQRRIDTELQARLAVDDTPGRWVERTRLGCECDEPGHDGCCMECGAAPETVRIWIRPSPSLYPWALPALRRWQAIAPTFEPNAVPVWISDRTVQWVAKWAETAPGLIWTERPAFGQRLAALTGMPYYANLGIDAETGRSLESHDPADGSCVVSIEANSVGRNLQRWNRNLITDVQPNGAKWEQLLARSHRDGQKAEEVTADVLFGCIEDVDGFWRAVRDSQYAEDMTGQAQKLTHADLEGVEEVEHARLREGPQWSKVSGP